MRAHHIAYLFVVIFSTACSTTNTSNTSKDKIVNIASHTRVHEAFNITSADFNTASNNNNIPTYAPNLWQQSKNNFVLMQEIVESFDADDQGFFGGPSEAKALSYISNTQRMLDKAKQHALVVSEFLNKPMKDIAFITPKITLMWQPDFHEIKRNLGILIRSLERNNSLARHTESKKRLQLKINSLEVNIVTNEIYTPLKQDIDKLQKRIIPISYAKTMKNLDLLNNQIITSPRGFEEIKELEERVKQDIKRSQHVSNDVNWINNLKPSQREKVVLHYRNGLEKLSENLFTIDISTLSFKEQITRLEYIYRKRNITEKIVTDKTEKNENVNAEEDQKIAITKTTVTIAKEVE